MAFFMGAALYAQQSQEILYADPTIFVQGDTYYLTGTGGSYGDGKGFSMLASKDLHNWYVPKKLKKSKGMILTKGKNTFGDKGFWAPQLFKEGHCYYYAYTANEQTALARSKSLFGPFEQEEVHPIDGSEKNIDPFIFKDDDGKHYLYHVRFDHGNYLWVAQFDLEKGKIDPQTLTKCFGQTEAWENTPSYPSDPIMEGPTVIKLKNKYYLFYSANHFMNIDYAMGYAIADSPMGPWVKQPNSPIIHRSIVGENGSGHGDVFKALDGKLYYVYHVHNGPDKVGPRRTRILPLHQEYLESTGSYKFWVAPNEVIVPHLQQQ